MTPPDLGAGPAKNDPSANRILALQALRQTKGMMRQLSIEPAGIVMHQDQDPVHTSYAWTGRLLLRD